jgi:hypothetical protein
MKKRHSLFSHLMRFKYEKSIILVELYELNFKNLCQLIFRGFITLNIKDLRSILEIYSA